MKFLKGLYLLDGPSRDLIYGPEEQRAISEWVEMTGPAQTKDTIRRNLHLLHDVEVIFSGWGAPLFDEELLDAAPNLKVVFYGAGSIRYFTTEAFWQRNIAVTSAYAANAVPVSEYTLAAILLSLKSFWKYSHLAKSGTGWAGEHRRPLMGNFQSTVGLVSLGMIARETLQLLNHFDLKRLVYCPFVTQEEADAIGVERVTLEGIFRRSDVVSVHTPLLSETVGMIQGCHFAAMKPNATFINTSRGPIVREDEMIEVLRERPDITAILDVTLSDPHAPAPDSPLLKLPNVILTPHIAGSMGREIRRLGHYMVQELHRYVAGKPFKWQLSEEHTRHMA
ncbi:MAG: hydroxyacid dehydrogenase [Chthoniobacteraceae bacterium]